MSKALSVDLRMRVLAAISAGMSGRQAAQRFGVSAASASRGDAQPKAQGGDRRSSQTGVDPISPDRRLLGLGT
ncbi:hypothetical protein ACFFKG_23215, partial [Aureimonas pseudogalii]